MFIGHFGVAFAAKRLTPRTSLGTLVAAAQLVDLVWPALLLAGIETVRIDGGPNPFTRLAFVHYPWTHSLAAAVGWAVAFGAAYLGVTRNRRGALVVAALVLSHWVLDFVTHRPDLPLAPGGAKVGLGLWSSVPGTLVVEGALFAAGVYLYATREDVRGGSPRWGFRGLVAVLVLLYAASMASTPPSATAIGVAGLLGWLFVAWAAWLDRARR